MRVATLLPQAIDDVSVLPAALEELGYDDLWIGESAHDAFLQSLGVSNATSTISVGTAVTIAFARTPMTVAMAAYDLARYSSGRFRLGLGSQVRAHIERRFSMPWSHPVDRLREFIAALKAIWTAWQDGTPLRFAGRFYNHTLMTDFFTPERHQWGPPPIYLAGVGPRMLRLAGAAADGLIVHPLHGQHFLDDVVLPELRRGADEAARTAMPEVWASVLLATGRSRGDIEAAVEKVRSQIAFYASTPAYLPVLRHYDAEHLHAQLHDLSRNAQWDTMSDLIPDSLLTQLTIIGTPADVGPEIARRYQTTVTGVTLQLPDARDVALHRAVLASVRGAIDHNALN
ncbi:putative F420-dependent oxidoreductase [Mycolicibacterium rhodesiae JS60]|nr:putative F420-dependent oxidoreductase [Mycolicibacterium rhodesiae JS60]